MIVKGEMSVAEFESDFYAEFGIPCDVIVDGEVASSDVSLSSIALASLALAGRKRLQLPDGVRVGDFRQHFEADYGFGLILYNIEIASDDVTLASLRTQDDCGDTRDRNLKVEFGMSVGTFESHFLAAFGVYCDVLERGGLADDDVQLIRIRSQPGHAADTAEIDISVNMLVGAAKDIIKAKTGLEIQLYQLIPADDDNAVGDIQSHDAKNAVAIERKNRGMTGTDVYLTADEDHFVRGERSRRRYWHRIYHSHQVEDLLAVGENATIEFKASARWNSHTRDKDKEVELAVVKSVAGFLNAGGGTLLIGVNDSAQPVGLKHDFKLISRRPNRDGFETWLTDLLGTTIGYPATANVEIMFEQIKGLDIARLNVHPASKPVFVETPQSNEDPLFYARINNSTRRLPANQVMDYVKDRWGANHPDSRAL